MISMLTLPALAQTVTSIRVISTASVLENPRGDSVVLGTVEPGELLEVLDQRGVWYFVRALEGTDMWRRGWVRDLFVEALGEIPPVPSDSPVGRQNSFRGFAQPRGASAPRQIATHRAHVGVPAIGGFRQPADGGDQLADPDLSRVLRERLLIR